MQTVFHKGVRCGVYGQFTVVDGKIESTDGDQDLRLLGLQVGQVLFTRAGGFATVVSEPTQHTISVRWNDEPPNGHAVEVLYYGEFTSTDGRRGSVPLLGVERG